MLPFKNHSLHPFRMYRSYVQGSCGKTRYQRAVEAEIIDNRTGIRPSVNHSEL